jgi:hypothetical protein
MLAKITKWLGKPINLFLTLTLFLAFFIRVFRVDQILGFYFDQGRDALVIWDFIHSHKLFLIGPTTGIEGIFRGPWYYWLITPFYWLGKGNPVYPSVFLAGITVFSIYLVYKIADKAGGRVPAVISLIIASFSFPFMLSGRWLSNPTPMFPISMVLIYSLLLIMEKKKWAWILTTLMLGMAMQFGSAAEVFYFPAVLIFAIWQRKNLPKGGILIASFAVFLAVFIPQIVFDLKHQGILRSAIGKFLFAEGSFKLSFWEIVKIRLPFYFDVFMSKIFQSLIPQRIFALTFFVILLIKRGELFKNFKFLVLGLFLLAPVVGMLFFQGNYGNVYDYYFTGYYFVFVLLFGLVLGAFWKNPAGKVIVILFLALFLKENLVPVKNYIIAGVDRPTTIAYGNQKQAIDWIYKDAGDRKFNVDVYVPPVIPHAYNYLFRWLGTNKYGVLPQDNQVPLLYTLYETDPPHPERLKAWLDRQKGIGKVMKEQTFGGITVQERERIKK